MNISSLTTDDLTERLGTGGLAFGCGPFFLRAVTRIPAIARGIHLLYADYPLAERDDLIDYHVAIKRPQSLRRWIRPLVVFEFDGMRPLTPLTIAHAYPLFEWALNWCVAFHSYQYLLLHAAVVERRGRALIMPGPPGAGKSTLTAALISRGWRLFSDEMAIIDLASHRLVPFPRPISLKNQSLEIIGRFVPGAVFSEVTHNTSKGTIAHMKVPAEHVGRSGETARSRWIVFPKYTPGAAAALTSRSKANTVMQLGRNSFNYYVHGRRGFETLVDLVDTGECLDFEYSGLDEAVACIDRLEPSGSP